MATEAKLLQKIRLCVVYNVAFPIKRLYRTSLLCCKIECAVVPVDITDTLSRLIRLMESTVVKIDNRRNVEDPLDTIR
jgi:hypothetical protein